MVGAGDDVHLQLRTGLGHAEGVALPGHDEPRDVGREQLRQPAAVRPAGRDQREGQRQHGGGTELAGGAAGDARAGAAAAEQQPAGEVELADDRGPGGVQARWRLGDATAGDPPGLLDAHHGQARREARVARGEQVGRRDTPARAVTEEQRSGAVRSLDEHAGRPDRGGDSTHGG